MSLPVHWVESLAGVPPGDPVEVDGDEAHHAVAVRRLRVGEQVVLTDGTRHPVTGDRGRDRQAAARGDGRRVDTVPARRPSFAVVQALPKGDRGELAVEMLTEIGVTAIVPWAAAPVVAVWQGERADKGLARWRATAREAAKQARRAWFPHVTELASTGDVVALVGAAAGASCSTRRRPGRWPRCRCPAAGRVVVVVGPEGGLTDEEVAAFTAAGAHAVRLGAEVLRTSTAGVAAVSALLSRTSRWG